MSKEFEGKTVLITGGATALAFAENGANLVIGDLNPEAKVTAELAELTL